MSFEISQLLCDCIIRFQAYLAASTVKQNTGKMKTHYYSFIISFFFVCCILERNNWLLFFLFFRETCVHVNQIFTETKRSIDVNSVRRFTTSRQVSGHVCSSNTINALYKRPMIALYIRDSLRDRWSHHKEWCTRKKFFRTIARNSEFDTSSSLHSGL